LTTLTLNQAAGSSPSRGFLGPREAATSCCGLAGTASLLLKCLIRFVLLLRLLFRPLGRGAVAVSAESIDVDGWREDAEELVRLVSGLNVDAASLSGFDASLLTREGVSVPDMAEAVGGLRGYVMRM
jgi:hypothetical protein